MPILPNLHPIYIFIYFSTNYDKKFFSIVKMAELTKKIPTGAVLDLLE
jgi:hypothetical protein